MANCDCEVALVNGPLESISPEKAPEAGAVVDFFGNVRPLENDKPIDGIEYEAHREMAMHQLQKIADEAGERFDLLAIKLHHSIGFIAAGETSLLLRVAAAHRGAAFEASRWIIDELKKRVPIWKSVRFPLRSESAKARPVLV